MTTINYETASYPLSELAFEELNTLSQLAFGPGNAIDGRWRVDNMPDPSGFLARSNGRLVGFKLGYASTSIRYYSWLGGIDPNYRKLGIGKALMEQQHRWVQSQGYRILETEVRKTNTAMINLNKIYGFIEIGSKRVNGNQVLILRKPIQNNLID